MRAVSPALITCDDGETVESTFHHPYWVVEGQNLDERPQPDQVPTGAEVPGVQGRWVDAGDVREGDVLLSRSGLRTTVTEVRLTPVYKRVYHLYVDNLHNFTVGNGQWLVHNGHGAGDADDLAPRRGYLYDYQTKRTTQLSATFNTEGQARQLAREKIGRLPISVGNNKLRSVNGRWQYRAKPVDTNSNHVHLERLDPNTGEVPENWHLYWLNGGAR